MSDTVNTDGGTYVEGDVNAGTFIGGDQIIVFSGYTGADLERVLATLRPMLAKDNVERRADLAHKRLTLSAPGTPPITLSEQAANDILAVAARRADEQDYLTALLVHSRYGRWATQFVPLAGTLTTVQHPPGWNDIPPEYTLLQISGEGPQRQINRIKLEDITQAIEQHPGLAVLGEPGAGKTTTLHKQAFDVARQRLTTGNGKLPLLLSLADYRDYDSPYAFVETIWKRFFADQPLVERLRSGSLFLLFDSLNEMTFKDDRDYRQRVSDWRDFQQQWPGNLMIFTCRSRDYSEPLGLPQVEIDRLNDERVRDFLGKYLPPDLAATAWTRLDKSPLLDLVRNPYYLHMLAYLLNAGQAWPANRAELFDQFARILLLREQDRHHPDWPGLGPMQNAFAALAEGLQPLGEGTRLPRQDWLARIPKSVPGPDGDVALSPPVLLRLGLAATLLDTERGEQDEQVRFYHHQMQEYFAARALLDRFRKGEELSSRWRRPRLMTEMPDPGPLGDAEPMPPPPTTGWEEPTVLAAGLTLHPADFVRAVCKVNPALAARCLSESGSSLLADEATATQVREALLADIADRRVHVRSRILAGDALGKLGDPRFKEIVVSDNRVLVPPLVRIPAGSFKIGSGLWQALRLILTGFARAQDETPSHQVDVPEFYLGQFPVTNGEYDCFIKAGGYQKEEYWHTDAARAWLRGEAVESSALKQQMDTWRAVKADPSLMQRSGFSPQARTAWEQLIKMDEAEVSGLFSKAYADRPRDRPAFWTDERFDNPSHPVVGVNWFEASAYCAWLDEQLRAAKAIESLQANHRVRLPTEAEWEKAARMKRGWVYPWGNRWESDRANTNESHLLSTTPVGVYPDGKTPEGVYDQSGNVWEWTATLYKPYPYRADDGRNEENADGSRGLRGGSWHNYGGQRAVCGPLRARAGQL